jgi:transcriptional regulator with XRE-family HTH domain
MANHLFASLLEALQEEYGTVTQTDLAKALGVTQPTISNWVNGGEPSKRNLKRLLEYFRDHHARTLIKPIVEFVPIEPVQLSNEWRFSSDNDVVEELKTQLHGKKGIYLFYGTTGEALYLGKTEASLYGEAKQRLKALPNRPMYIPVKGRVLQMGAMARYLSAYEVSIPAAVKNVESFMLRAFANELRNRNGGNFKLAMKQKEGGG